MYDFPQFDFKFKNKNFSKLLKKPLLKSFKKEVSRFILVSIVLSSIFGFLSGSLFSIYFYFQLKDYLGLPSGFLVGRTIKDNFVQETDNLYSPQGIQESATIRAVKEVSPAVVSIVVLKDVPVFEKYYYEPFKEFFEETPFKYKVPQYEQKGTEKREVGGGTGFIVSSDGIILTNKHVVLEEEAEYSVYSNDGRKFLAKVLARDPLQDLAILKIEQEKTVDGDGQFELKPFPVAKLGNSDELQIGQSVITIGNALGEFRNTVSLGVVSGLGRSITASDAQGSFVETLEDVIQTDAAINKGNSGGPLVNLRGEVIGINTAMAADAQSIGFALPINKVKRSIEQVKEIGKIVYPFLGVRYILIDQDVKEEKDLPVDYGALIIVGPNGEQAIWPDSAAERIGLEEGDIILEFNNQKITRENSLVKLITKYKPGDRVTLKYRQGDEEKIAEIVLGERSEY